MHMPVHHARPVHQLSHAPIVHMEVPFQRARQFSQPNLRMPYAAQHHPAPMPMQVPMPMPPPQPMHHHPLPPHAHHHPAAHNNHHDQAASWSPSPSVSPPALSHGPVRPRPPPPPADQDSFPPAKRARAEPPTRRLSLNDVSDSDPADSSASWTQHQMSSSSQHATGGASSANGASNGAGSDEKRRNFLERNRKAALKCRQKKKEYVKSLEDTVARLSAENEELHESVRQLHEQIMQMQQMMTDPMDVKHSIMMHQPQHHHQHQQRHQQQPPLHQPQPPSSSS